MISNIAAGLLRHISDNEMAMERATHGPIISWHIIKSDTIDRMLLIHLIKSKQHFFPFHDNVISSINLLFI